MEISFGFSRDESKVWRNFVSSTLSARNAFERVLRDPSSPRKRQSYWQVVLPRVAPAVLRKNATIEEIMVIINTRQSSPKQGVEQGSLKRISGVQSCGFQMNSILKTPFQENNKVGSPHFTKTHISKFQVFHFCFSFVGTTGGREVEE